MTYLAKIITVSLVIFLTACAGQRPNHLGIFNHQLAPCPNTPNCVSSFSSDKTHQISPVKTVLNTNDSYEKLVRILTDFENVTFVTKSKQYIHTEFSSSFLGFIDDVEFLLMPEVIHVRSASRLGYSDFGVNRKRVEAIRERFHAKQ